jgi:hypothetical protein
MEIFKNANCDIINYILSYDERFTIKNGNVHLISFKKYETIIQLLEKTMKWRFEQSKAYRSVGFYKHITYYNLFHPNLYWKFVIIVMNMSL